MTYALIVWSLVAISPTEWQQVNIRKHYYEWRPLLTVDNNGGVDAQSNCHAIAQDLSIPKDKYRCIRTK